MNDRDEMAQALASALPLMAISGMTRETAAYVAANNLIKQGWRLVPSWLVPLPTSDDTTFTEQADYGSDAR